jgi:hypothetical protein
VTVDMRERVAALKHDLAKYVAWRSANFDDAAWSGPLTDDFAQALQADVLRTRGDDPAWVVWQRWAAELPAPSGEPELVAVAEAVAELEALEPALRAGGDALARARPTIRAAQQRIRSELAGLHRRLVGG